MEFINTVIGTPLGYLMWVCYWICKNYGLAIILFTVLTKVILFPINIWVQKNSIKMVKLQPEVNQIMARHVGNKDKAAEEQMALYKREHYRPMVGMIPMLIQIPIILGLISVVYNPLQHLLHMDPQIISAFVAEATQLTGMELGSTAQLKVIELIQNPETLGAFAALQVPGADVAGAVEKVLVQIFHSGKQDAGQQQEQAQLRAGVSQQIDGDGVIEQSGYRRHQREQDQKSRQAPAQHLGDGQAVAEGMVLRGQVGHRYRQTDGSDGHDHGIDRHDELIKPHDLRPNQPGEQDTVKKPQQLGSKAGAGQHQGSVEHGCAVEFQGAPPFTLQAYSQGLSGMPV